jgi:hypothetical protein
MIYSRRVVIRAAKDRGIPLNSHITGRKDIHPNILLNYARSVFNNRREEKDFIEFVKNHKRKSNRK